MAGPVVMLDKDCGVQGKLQYTKSRDKPVYTYLGVPYAEPPVGTRRFKPTAPLKLWNGIRDASKHGACCPQSKAMHKFAMPRYPDIGEMSEDCLFVNVYTPRSPMDGEGQAVSTTGLPVMVWIHGGGMMIGCSDSFDGTVLSAKHEVIVVTFNYRLNILGFLATPDGYIRGNMGLLDQVEALKWVQKYIQKFGGDPTNVTIFGESAGAMSASLHMISPLSKGLFQRVICESGTTLFFGMLGSMKQNTETLKEKFQSYGVDYTKGVELENFLQKMDSTELMSKFFGDYRPIADGQFLPESPLSMFKRSDSPPVELLCGVNSDDGHLLTNMLLQKIHAPNFQWNKESASAVLQEFLYDLVLPDHPDKASISARMQEMYLDQCTQAESFHRQTVQVVGDVFFDAPAILLANIQNARAKTFFYEFKHRPCFSKLPPWAFADHTDDIPYVFGEPYNPLFQDQWSEEDERLSDLVMKYWTNFAKRGDPNGHDVPEWPRYDSEQQKYIVLQNQPEICSKRKPEQAGLWNRAYEDTH